MIETGTDLTSVPRLAQHRLYPPMGTATLPPRTGGTSHSEIKTV